MIDERVKEVSAAEVPERRKRASSLVSFPIVFVGMFDESPVMMNVDVEGTDVCVVSAVSCAPL